MIILSIFLILVIITTIVIITSIIIIIRTIIILITVIVIIKIINILITIILEIILKSNSINSINNNNKKLSFPICFSLFKMLKESDSVTEH